MKKLYYEKIKKLSVRLLAIILSFVLFMAGSNVVEAINFNGSQQAFYNLSNGEQVRIEYHGGEPHYHDSKAQQIFLMVVLIIVIKSCLKNQQETL